MSEKIEAQRDKEHWQGSYGKSCNTLTTVTWNLNKTIEITILHFY